MRRDGNNERASQLEAGDGRGPTENALNLSFAKDAPLCVAATARDYIAGVACTAAYVKVIARARATGAKARGVIINSPISASSIDTDLPRCLQRCHFFPRAIPPSRYLPGRSGRCCCLVGPLESRPLVPRKHVFCSTYVNHAPKVTNETACIHRRFDEKRKVLVVGRERVLRDRRVRISVEFHRVPHQRRRVCVCTCVYRTVA